MISYRPATSADLERVTAWTVTEPVGWIDAARYRADLAEGMYRPHWTWLAEDAGGRLAGRALWWGPATATQPVALDCLDVDPAAGDRARIGAQLIAATLPSAATGAQYTIKTTGGWREDPARAQAVAWRREAARAAGLQHEVERLQFAWTPDRGVPAATGSLRFTQATDEQFLEVFERIAHASLDAQTRARVAAHGARESARREMDFYLDAPGERHWWRLAHTPDGRLAGLAIPSATPYARNVGYLGVVPELRGHGHVDEILGEITRLHAAAGAERITATTDLANAPIAAAFTRAGYQITEIRLTYTR
ncbi:GNAT family N-acetyltransferase [Nonomuraea sp. NPDC050790]|uniref:GNAT family N-acetyltransferase n=1 Tax=Nonomuraea sp. NPDC050790 TaxID=3364371 RepID=UPI00379400CB